MKQSLAKSEIENSKMQLRDSERELIEVIATILVDIVLKESELPGEISKTETEKNLENIFKN